MVRRRGPGRQQGQALPPLVAPRRAPAGRQQISYLIFTAIRPATGEDFTLVLPTEDTAAMQVFLDHVAASRPANAHLVMVLDGAGWHVSRDLVVPPSINAGRSRQV
jgi:hypothetical protein